jgi:hypothetical protein
MALASQIYCLPMLSCSPTVIAPNVPITWRSRWPLRCPATGSIIMVEQNAKKGLEFCDVGYVLVAGELAMAADARDLLAADEVGRLFFGG